MKTLTAIVILSALALPAHAATIHNLDKVEHRIRVDNGGQVQLLTLAPGAMHRMIGGFMQAQVEGHEPRTIEGQNEYVIWPGGRLEIQRRVDMKKMND